MIWAFVDCENVGPLKNIDFSPYERVILFLGPNNHTLSLPAGTGYLIQPIQVAKGGKNNLDFHLALHMGMHHGTVPKSVAFHLISNDKGMDVLVEHLMSLGRPCRKVPVVLSDVAPKPVVAQPPTKQTHHSPSDPRITKLIDGLKSANRPKKRQGLLNWIGSSMNGQSPKPDPEVILNELIKRKAIRENGGKIEYCLKT